jgi:hypothetical protein
MSTLEPIQRHFFWAATSGRASGAVNVRRRPPGTLKSTVAGGAGIPGGVQRRERRARLRQAGSVASLRALFRRVFALIQDFLLLCRLRAHSSSLARSLKSVLGSAAKYFAMRRLHPQGVADIRAGSEDCLAELQLVLGALGSKHAHSASELSHALDSLIVLLVRIKPVRHATSASIPGSVSGDVDGAATPPRACAEARPPRHHPSRTQ